MAVTMALTAAIQDLEDLVRSMDLKLESLMADNRSQEMGSDRGVVLW